MPEKFSTGVSIKIYVVLTKAEYISYLFNAIIKYRNL